MTVPFDVFSVVHEHPKQEKARIASKAKIITHLGIGLIPSFCPPYFSYYAENPRINQPL
jgi:hypothetical protein